MGIRAFLVSALIACLLGGVLAGTAAAEASPEAKAACKELKDKIKGKKGKAKRKAKAKYKKCLTKYDEANPPEIDGGGGTDGGGGEVTPPPTDPKAAAQALIENQEFYRPFATQYTSGEELIRFCSGGTYFRRYTSSGSVSTTEYHDYGNWTITDAQQGTADGYTGYVATINAVGTYDGAQVNGNMRVAVSSQTTQALIDVGNGYKEFIRRNVSGSC